MNARVKIISVLVSFGLFGQLLHGTAPKTTLVYSPNKKFVILWFDTEGKLPIGSTRSILLQELPHGDAPFSLVTFPRYTKAAWSSDSRHCFILDAPDNGNMNTWLFTAKDAGARDNIVRINPLCSLYEKFAAQPDAHGLWRPGIEEIHWQDSATLELTASDNLGWYRITLKMDAIDKPRIDRLPPPSSQE